RGAGASVAPPGREPIPRFRGFPLKVRPIDGILISNLSGNSAMLETSLSLLDRLRTTPDKASWQRLDDLYRPWLLRWLLGRDPSLREEAEALVQDVLSVLARELSQFRHDRPGSFRRWLLGITVHRLKNFWRSRRRRPSAHGEPPINDLLAQLEDPNSELSR